MQATTEALTEAIYDAALDPAHWPAVLARLKAAFRTEAETFYVLDFHTHQVGEAHLAGVAPEWLARVDAVREVLTSDGRTLVQGALGWLWARSPRTVPIPGCRTVAQVEENAGALERGPLTAEQVAQIASLLGR